MAKNVILFIGDGMGLSQISAAIYNQPGFSLERFPVIGFQSTAAADDLITDSAAAATAMATGQKTRNNAIGVDTLLQPLTTIFDVAKGQEMATGVLVTSTLVHATPAAFLAHQSSRSLYEQIASDFAASDVDMLIGGGRQYFDRRSSDDRVLTGELKARGVAVYDYFSNDIFRLNPKTETPFIYFTADNQPLPAFQGRDYLPAATELAINYLGKRSPQGFFLLVEGSQIDWSCHANQPESFFSEMEDFDQALKVALDFALRDKNTLVVVTADHETGGMALNPGSKHRRLSLAFTTNGHTGSMVPVFALGPGCELFRGIYENTAIFEKLKKVLESKEP
jgi:alkaline phosphatase